MEEKEIDPDRIADFWLESAERDFDTMQNLMRSGDRSWALFLGHLVLEKLLKAHFVKRNRMHAIHSHDLLRLATKAGLELTADRVEWLDVVSTFNINARYDSYKHSFYRQCTTEFTVLWSGGIAELRTWLIKGL